MFTSLIGWIGAGLMLGGCVIALVLGGPRERTGAVVYLLCWLLSTFLRVQFGQALSSTAAIWVLDILLLFTFGALIWKSDKAWPVWAAALQLLIMTCQFLFLINFAPTVSAYSTVINFSSLGIILALAWGSVASWQERLAISASSNDLGRYS
ncbi:MULTISPECIES: hypothetical protein [unclassified Brevundimonas]|uniref:hypothetical protein n=1 Tax=unclassified Brevundimonas TaxID=2622653 RepID=UPI0025BB953F|nr:MULTISPECIES: hypothetical protein [unclassified Brevundimonas]